LLMGILIPVLGRARGQAQTVVCASNLKNYGSALFMYAGDNDDKAPFSFSWLYLMETIFKNNMDPRSGGCPQECRWHYDKDKPDGTLWPYLKNINVHMCPTFKNYARNAKCPNSAHSALLPYNPTYNYSMNRWLGLYCLELYRVGEAEGRILLDSEPSLKLSQVKRTAQCFAFSEENMWTIDHRARDGAKYYSTSSIGKNDLWLYANKAAKNSAVANFATYHKVSKSKKNEGYANAVFVDGHVATVRGLAGYDAYLEYGRPFIGHELPNIW